MNRGNISSLKNRQNLVRRAKSQQNQCRRVRISERPIEMITFRLPGAVGLLGLQNIANNSRKKLLPVRAAQLINPLAAIEQTVVVAIARKPVVAVVTLKCVVEQ